MDLQIAVLELQKRRFLRRYFGSEDFELTQTVHCKIVLNPRMRSTAGRARYSLNQIELNTRLLSENPDHIEQTLGHELAHLLSYEIFGSKLGRGHKKAWRSVMTRFGLEADRTHSLDTSGLKRVHMPKAEAACQCRTHLIKSRRYNKMRRGVNYTCTICKSRLVLIEKSIQD